MPSGSVRRAVDEQAVPEVGIAVAPLEVPAAPAGGETEGDRRLPEQAVDRIVIGEPVPGRHTDLARHEPTGRRPPSGPDDTHEPPPGGTHGGGEAPDLRPPHLEVAGEARVRSAC